MADIARLTHRLAKKTDAPALAALFCSGERELNLKPSVCSPENRQNLIQLFVEKCSSRKVRIVSNGPILVGMLMIGARKNGVTAIDYVVVDQEFRRKGVGPILIRHFIRSRKAIISLRAEAINEYSKRMLMRCGFQTDGKQSLSGYPFLVWHRPQT
jgi:ribosomal protein S18 acetylase RimI-like enzyme